MKRTALLITIIIIVATAVSAGCTGTEQPAPAATQTTAMATTVVKAPVTTTSPPATPISQVSVSDNTITIKDFTFTPQTMTVKTGEIVRWENNEPDQNYVHRIVFTDPTGNIIKYDSGVLSPGQSWSQKFTAPGTYTYYCKIHPQMTGTVIVI